MPAPRDGWRPLAIGRKETATKAEDLAADFWRRTGPPPAFPRDLEGPVLWGLPLAIVKLPRLRAVDVDAWFAERGRRHQIAGRDRPLRGCLLAAAGAGVVFIDAGDSADEQRFTLSHEVAHFVADYLVPRETVLARLGSGYADILDGKRAALPADRIDGLLAGVSLGVHRHLMDRGRETLPRVIRAESRADALALELLAPRDAVLRMTRRRRATLEGDGLEALLCSQFGLPPAVARGYAMRIRPDPSSAPVSIRAWLVGRVEVSPAPRNLPRKPTDSE